MSLVERDRLGRIDLDAYTHVILVDGSWGDLGEAGTAALDRWVEQGGILVTERGRRSGQTAGCAARRGQPPRRARRLRARPPSSGGTWIGDATGTPSASAAPSSRSSWTSPTRWPGATGARDCPSSASARTCSSRTPTTRTAPGRYTAQPLLAGYVSADNQAKIAGSAAVLSDRRGRGAVVRFLDPVDFRGFWHGTRRLLLNALFFGDAIEETVIRGAS